jgi:hypothetical protein
MTVSINSANDGARRSSESLNDSAVVLGDMTAALARGEVADGTRLIEHALLLNVHWEQLTTAVHEGIELGYGHREASGPR